MAEHCYRVPGSISNHDDQSPNPSGTAITQYVCVRLLRRLTGAGAIFISGHAAEARSLHTGGVTGSIPVAPTIISAEKLEMLDRQCRSIGIYRKQLVLMHAQRCALSVHRPRNFPAHYSARPRVSRFAASQPGRRRERQPSLGDLDARG